MCCQPSNRCSLPAPETDQRRRYSIRMQPRWNHARSAAKPNPSSHAQGLESKEISPPSGRWRKMSLTSPLIDRDITPTDDSFGVADDSPTLAILVSWEPKRKLRLLTLLIQFPGLYF